VTHDNYGVMSQSCFESAKRLFLVLSPSHWVAGPLIPTSLSPAAKAIDARPLVVRPNIGWSRRQRGNSTAVSFWVKNAPVNAHVLVRAAGAVLPDKLRSFTPLFFRSYLSHKQTVSEGFTSKRTASQEDQRCMIAESRFPELRTVAGGEKLLV
jgi:hypothetical protein